jgi:hypothetical protein
VRDWRFWVEAAKIAIAVVTATIALVTWRSHLAEQRDQQAFEFRLQAAQVVMSEPTCKGGVEKANELQTLFPEQLADFGTEPFAAFLCLAIDHPEKFGPSGKPTSTTPLFTFTTTTTP